MAYPAKEPDEDTFRHEIISLAKKYRQYVYRKIVQLLRISGWQANRKKIERIWHEEVSTLPKRHKRQRRLYHKYCSIIRMRPNAPNYLQAIDFVHDK